jgi:nucleoside-diphosphate-sugar epimerase
VAELNINKIAIAMPSANQSVITDLVSRARRLNLPVSVTPNIFDLVHNPTKNTYRHSVKIDDMLGIKEIQQESVDRLNLGRNKRVLVTGGGGYIGAHLIPMLIEDGYYVKIIENFTYGRHGIRSFENHPQVEIIEGDICDIRAVVNSLKDVDYIIALAALVGDPACSLNAKETLNLNYEATKILVETASFYGIKRLIFASSCSVYGASSDQFLTEDSPLNPVSLYAKTRIMSEEVLLDRCGNIEPVILRLSTVFGLSDRMRFDLVVNTLTARGVVDGKFQVFGGNQWRPFIHCRDVAQAFRLALKASSEDVKPTIFNVGSTSMNFTINDVAKIIEHKLPGVQVEYQDVIDDPRNYKVNFDRISKYLKFNTSISVEQGVDEMILALSQDPELRLYSDASYSNVQFLKSVFKTHFE